MIKALIHLQDLRRKLYVKGKAEPHWRFWGLYTHVCKKEVLYEAYRLAKRNKGTPGSDGVTFAAIEAGDVDAYLETLRTELINQTYYPMKGRHVNIPKSDGKSTRKLTIPSIKDRIVQGAVKLILEPIFESDFQKGSYGYRPKRQAKEAIHHVSEAIAMRQKTQIIDVDISKFFDNVKHDIMLRKIAQRINDGKVLHLVKLILKSTGKRGLPQGSPLSPLLSNVYLNDIDKMLEKAKSVTQRQGCSNIEYARWADDLIIMVDGYKCNRWLVGAATKRLREELASLGLSLNTEKTKIVDLSRIGERFTFLGFDFRSIKIRKNIIGIIKTPKKQARLKLQQKLKRIFKHKRSRAIREVVVLINPIIRGWVNYYRIGNSSRCFQGVRNYVEKKIRRHLYQARQKRGFGWKRWSSEQIHRYSGVYHDYQVRHIGQQKCLQHNKSHKLQHEAIKKA